MFTGAYDQCRYSDKLKYCINHKLTAAPFDLRVNLGFGSEQELIDFGMY